MLVDTHVMIWLADDDARLGPRTRALMQSGEVVHFSSISVLEMVIKSMRRRLRVPGPICSHFERFGLHHLPFTGVHAVALADFPELTKHDPFDRSLLAQAKVEDSTFLTADRVLLALDYPWIVDASA